MSTYIHGQHASVTDSYQRRGVANSAPYLIADLAPGRSVLDVGCGPGTITLDLAQRVAPGRVLGLDASEAALELARTTTARSGLPVEFRAGDAHDLDLADGSFDIVHAHQVLQHLSDPVRTLQEMARVAAPGGIVAAADADYSGMFWYPRLPELTEWQLLYQQLARLNGGEPDAARHLISWARAAGLTDVSFSVHTWTYADPSERTFWGQTWARRTLESEFAERSLAAGLTDQAGLERIAAGWRAWAAEPDGVFVIPHGAIRCQL